MGLFNPFATEPAPSAVDSAPGTIAHSRRVDQLLAALLVGLAGRVGVHDESKLGDVEKPIFDEFAPRLATTEYGSDAYKADLEQMGVALEHHYAENRHHPEHFENGVDGMTLIDVLEMLADWKAATERNKGGDLRTSLGIQKERFGLSDQLVSILTNTAEEMGWL